MAEHLDGINMYRLAVVLEARRRRAAKAEREALAANPEALAALKLKCAELTTSIGRLTHGIETLIKRKAELTSQLQELQHIKCPHSDQPPPTYDRSQFCSYCGIELRII